MSKPFLIVNIIEGKLGVIHERPTWEQAVDCAVQLASEQCDKGTQKKLILPWCGLTTNRWK